MKIKLETNMDKLKMHSPDITQQNIDKLLELFPNCKTEKQDANGDLGTGVDFDLLKQELSKNIVEGQQERYQLNWPGKKEALLTANAPIAKTLRPCREESVDFDTTENLFIEGDNLDALKLLQEAYLGKVKMIYIDPPYNTGKDFIYADNFSESASEYLLASAQKNEEGNRMIANVESSGRFHSAWLSMMYSRIKLARNLLTGDGVIFISIDDNEVSNLKSICDEIFGGENLLSIQHIQVRYANKTLNEKNDWQPVMEYVFVYAKDSNLFKPNKEFEEYGIEKFIYEFEELGPGTEIIVKGRKVTVFKQGDWKRIKHETPGTNLLKETWVSGSIYSGTGNGQMVQRVIEPRLEVDGYGALYKIDGLGEDGLGYRYFSGPQKENATRSKMFSGVPLVTLEELKSGTARKYKSISNMSIFEDFSPDFGNIGSEGGVKYNSGKKPVKMIKGLIDLCNLDDGDIVLDFFAGSATTAHSVFEINSEDNLKRKFILIQMPEALSEEIKEQKDTYTFLTSISKPPYLTELSKERIRRAGKKIKEAYPVATELDTGFRVLKIDSSNMNDVHYTPDTVSKDDLFNQVEHIKTDRSPEDLLFQVMLDWGVDLSLPIRKETIEGKEVYFVNDDDLVACFDKGIDEALIKALSAKQPLRVVFRDDGFVSDSVKINVEQIFKQLAPATDIKAI